MMPETDPNITLLLGEVRGQLREIIHTMNNQSMKNDAVARQLAKLEGVPEQLDKLDARMTKLEATENRRSGALSFGQWLMQSNVVIYAILAAGAAYAYVKGVFSQ